MPQQQGYWEACAHSRVWPTPKGVSWRRSPPPRLRAGQRLPLGLGLPESSLGKPRGRDPGKGAHAGGKRAVGTSGARVPGPQPSAPTPGSSPSSYGDGAARLLGPRRGRRASPWPFPAAGVARASSTPAPRRLSRTPPRTPRSPPSSSETPGPELPSPPKERGPPSSGTAPRASGCLRDMGGEEGRDCASGARDSISASLRRWQKIVLFYLVKHSLVSGSSVKTT